MDVRVKLFNDLNKHVNYAVIKSRLDFTNGYPDGDIDIILDKNDLTKTKSILSLHEFYLRKWGDTPACTSIYLHNQLFYKIHIHEDLNFKLSNKEINIKGNDYFLSRKIFEKNYNLFFLSINDEILIQYCLMLYRNSFFIFIIRLILGRNYAEKTIQKKINYCLELDLNCSVEPIFNTNKKYPSYFSYYILKDKFKKIKIVSLKKDKTKSKPLFHVGIIGMDGAGKSTLTKNLKNYFSKSIKCESIYLGQYRGYDVKIYKKFVLRIAKKIFNKENSYVYNLFESLLWIRIAWVRYSRWKHIVKLNKSGVLTLSDRYPLKEFWDMKLPMDGPRLLNSSTASGLLNLLSKLEMSIYNKIKTPRLIICLDLPCKLASARHTDGNEDLNPKYNAIQSLLRVDNGDLNIVRIDVSNMDKTMVLQRSINIVSKYLNDN